MGRLDVTLFNEHYYFPGGGATKFGFADGGALHNGAFGNRAQNK